MKNAFVRYACNNVNSASVNKSVIEVAATAIHRQVMRYKVKYRRYPGGIASNKPCDPAVN